MIATRSIGVLEYWSDAFMQIEEIALIGYIKIILKSTTPPLQNSTTPFRFGRHS
jgi:hypothetical protein